jgi:hypothetical protein
MTPDPYAANINALLNARAEAVCQKLLPLGKRIGHLWKVGVTDGQPGKSLEVDLEGEHAGRWVDRAQDLRGTLLTLWMDNRNLKYGEALAECADWLGVPRKEKSAPKIIGMNIDYSDPKGTAANFADDDPIPDTTDPDPIPEAKAETVDWDSCLMNFTEERSEEVATARGYSQNFVDWLHEQEMIGTYKGCVAFPVHNAAGEVVRIHYKTGDSWRYHPKGSGDSAPLIVGAPLAHATEVLAFESQWDAFAVLDKLESHTEANAGRYCAYITRGATSNNNMSKVAVAKLIACPQNDPAEKASKATGRTPAEEWLFKIQSTKHKSTAFSVFETPAGHKDANDWIRADKPTGDEVARLIAGAKNPLHKDVVRGFNSFPTDPPREDVLFGNGQGRVGEAHFLNSGSGMGKSVAGGGISITWPLGLPYFGIHPTRPLKIIHFCGEDDESTMGQIREGFLAHSEEITGRRLTARDLLPLDNMVRTDFSREFTGDSFLARLEEMLIDEHADVVLINPLLSFIGGDIVECVSKFLRDGLGPILKRHRCCALICHHTCKLSKTSWEEMDLTYSGIGGGEVANAPRSTFTLAPTKVKGLMVLHVSKRKTTGWRDESGTCMDYAFFKRTDNSTRPGWIPVGYDEAEEMIGAGGMKGSGATVEHVFEELATGATRRDALIERVMKKGQCGKRTAITVIGNSRLSGRVQEYWETPPTGGKKQLWFRLAETTEEDAK